MVSLVTKFEVNIPDLTSLMILPDILTVIQQKLLEDRRLLVDLKIKPQVILTNHVKSIFIENEFDQFELNHKLQQFSRCIQDIKLFEIFCKMKFKNDDSKRIIYEFLISFEDVLLDQSIARGGYRGKYANIDILELIFKRSQALIIDSFTLNYLTIKRQNGPDLKNVKKLVFKEFCSQNSDLNQLVKVFPLLESLDVGEIYADDDDFFDEIKSFFQNNILEHLKFFKAFCYKSTDSAIEVPTMEIKIVADLCKASEFLSSFLNPNLSSMFPNFQVNIKYSFFKGKRGDLCQLTLIFKKNIDNENVYSFDILFEDWC
eukprot:403343995